MAECCKINLGLAKKKRLLWTVLLINLGLFCVQFTAAWIAHSTTLLADSLDMLGDGLTYGFSLYVVNKNTAWLNRAAVLKGLVILVLAIVVFIEAVDKIFFTSLQPNDSLMIFFGFLGLIANGICFYLLTQQRDTDINLRSTWICSRNDIIGNVAVIFTGFSVMILQSPWPDVIVGLGFVAVLINSALGILRDAHQEKPTA